MEDETISSRAGSGPRLRGDRWARAGAKSGSDKVDPGHCQRALEKEGVPVPAQNLNLPRKTLTCYYCGVRVMRREDGKGRQQGCSDDKQLRGRMIRATFRARALATFQRCSYLRSEIGRPLTAESAHNIAVLQSRPQAKSRSQSFLQKRATQRAKGFSIFFAEIMMRCASPTLSAFSRTWDNLVDGDPKRQAGSTKHLDRACRDTLQSVLRRT